MTATQPGVAVFGCGYWGKNIVRNLAALGVRLVVVDPAEEGRARAQAVAPGCAVAERPDQVLGDPSLAAVVVATPAETHRDMCARALAAGKDVLVEKPLALRYEEGAELVVLAARNDRILMVGHLLHYHPAVIKLGELIAAGTLGKIQYIYSNRLNLGKVRREENILWSFAPHDISVILRFIGQLPFEVIAIGGAYLQPNIADTTVTHLLFDNGVRAHIYVSWLHPYKEQRLVVVGDRQMAVFDDVASEDKLVLFDQHVEVDRNGALVPVKQPPEPVALDWQEPLRAECEQFLASVTSRTPPPTDGVEGLRTLAVLQAAQRSLVTQGRPVLLPFDLAASGG